MRGGMSMGSPMMGPALYLSSALSELYSRHGMHGQVAATLPITAVSMWRPLGRARALP